MSSRTALADEAVRFDLVVACEICAHIYINGNPLTTGPSARFISETPRELLLLAGGLPSARVGGAQIIGAAVPPDTAAAFVKVLSEIGAFHADYLGVPPAPLPDILTIEPLRRPRRGELWGFYSDPSLALLGASISRLTGVLQGDSLPPQRNVYTFLAHELAHHYFGWKVGAGTTQRDFFGEPFATFLELKALRARYGEEEYQRAVGRLRDRVLDGPEPVSPEVATQEEIERARYGSAPLLLLALETVIGEARMRALLGALVRAPDVEKRGADLAYLRSVGLGVGVDRALWERWERQCLRTPLQQNFCLRSLGEGAEGDVR